VAPLQFVSLVHEGSQAPAAVQTLPAAHSVSPVQGTHAWVVVSQWGRVGLVQSALVAQPSVGAQQPLVQTLPEPQLAESEQLKMPDAHWPGARHWPETQVSPVAQSAVVAQTAGLELLEHALSAAAAKSDASSAREKDCVMGNTSDVR